MTPRQTTVQATSESVEVARPFVPTPERLSQYLERNIKDVVTELESVDGREKIYRNLLDHEEEIRKIDPTFDSEILRRQLDLVAETLQQKQRFLETVQEPKSKEKQGFWTWAWEKIKSVLLFPVRHPAITLLLLAAAAAAIGMYYSGLGNTLLEWLPNYSDKAAAVAGEAAPATTAEMALPGTGQFGGVAPPTLPKGLEGARPR